MAKSVFFAAPEYPDRYDPNNARISRIRGEMARYVSDDRYVECNDPEDADLVLYIETGDFKWKSHAAVLGSQKILQRHSAKTLTYNQEDAAAVFLDGLYVHSEHPKFIEGHQRSWLQSWLYNEELYRVSATRIDQETTGPLCSFRGNISH